MKTKIAILFFFITIQLAKSQYAASGVKSEGFGIFKGAKNVSVVLTGDADADKALKDAVAKNWTLTPVTYIPFSELETKISDNTSCFMLFFDIQSDKGQTYNFFGILPGGKKKISKYSYDDVLAYCPIDRLLTETNIANAAFRFPVMVSSMQFVMNKIDKSNLNGGSFSMGKQFNEINCKNVKKVKTKTLLINSELGLEEKDIKEEYKYKFEIVDKKKIEEAIKTKDPKYLVFQSAITLNKFIFIFDCETYTCVYSSINMMGMKVKSKDFKEIIEQLSN